MDWAPRTRGESFQPGRERENLTNIRGFRGSVSMEKTLGISKKKRERGDFGGETEVLQVGGANLEKGGGEGGVEIGKSMLYSAMKKKDARRAKEED